MSEDKLKELEKIFNNDLDLMLFYVSWIKNGLNAKRAYLELHPNVGKHSAETLGSRMLSKVDIPLVMQAYGLDKNLYFTQLKEGVTAEKRDQFSGEMYPDHKTRKDYHDKLGKLLGIEIESGTNINISGDKVIAILGGVTSDLHSDNGDTQNIEVK